MLSGRAWAEAFINTLEKDGCRIEDGIEALEVFASQVSSLRGTVFGRSAAEKLEALLRDGMKKAGVSSPAYEAALCFIVLMVRKNAFRHVDRVIDEVNKILDKKNGIVRVVVEYAAAPGKDDSSAKPIDEERIKEWVKKRSGAARVEMLTHNNQGLIGGYRLRIGDEIIDASVRSQLRELEACLSASDGGY